MRYTLRSRATAWLGQLKPGRKAVVTVSLEGTSLRLTASRGRRILAWVNLPFNPQLVTDDLVNSPDELATVLRNAVRRLEYHPSSTLAVYPGLRSVSRIISIPRASEINPAVVLTREARRLMGTTPEQNYLHWTRVSRDQTTDQYYVLAIPRNRMDAFVRTLAGAALLPRVVDLKTLALSRATGVADGIIVNLEHTYINLIIFSKYVPQVANTVVLDEVTTLDEQQATDRVLEELQRSVSFYQERNPAGGGPLPLFLSGGHPLLESDTLALAIQQTLNTSPQVPKLPLQYPPDFPIPMYLSNLGILIR